MMKRLFSLQIPSLFGIILLLIGVSLTSYLVDQGVILKGRAAPDKTPENLLITNVSSTEFTVIYTTTESVVGSVSYGPQKAGGSVALDDRDQVSGRTTPSTIHSITVHNLNPGTTYYFSILSGGDIFKNNEQPYEVKTAPTLSQAPPEIAPVTGSVGFSGQETEDLIILFSSANAQQRSALLKPDNSYEISLDGLRTQNLSQFATFASDTEAQLIIFSAKAASSAKVLTKNTHPVPLITFGESYDFTLSTQPLAQEQTASGSAQSFPQIAQTTNQAAIGITTPDEAEQFTDQRPVFTGTAVPGETVDVVIHSDEAVTASTKVASNGTWEFRPPQPLNPGNHTITIKTRDLTGTIRAFTRSFTVYAQGSQFVEPSVSPTDTPTPTLIDMQPSESPTPTTLVETATPTLAVATPTPLISGIPTPTSPPPVSGPADLALGGILGAGMLVVGLVLFFLMRGSAL